MSNNVIEDTYPPNDSDNTNQHGIDNLPTGNQAVDFSEKAAGGVKFQSLFSLQKSGQDSYETEEKDDGALVDISSIGFGTISALTTLLASDDMVSAAGYQQLIRVIQTIRINIEQRMETFSDNAQQEGTFSQVNTFFGADKSEMPTLTTLITVTKYIIDADQVVTNIPIVISTEDYNLSVQYGTFIQRSGEPGFSVVETGGQFIAEVAGFYFFSEGGKEPILPITVWLHTIPDNSVIINVELFKDTDTENTIDYLPQLFKLYDGGSFTGAYDPDSFDEMFPNEATNTHAISLDKATNVYPFYLELIDDDVFYAHEKYNLVFSIDANTSETAYKTLPSQSLPILIRDDENSLVIAADNQWNNAYINSTGYEGEIFKQMVSVPNLTDNQMLSVDISSENEALLWFSTQENTGFQPNISIDITKDSTVAVWSQAIDNSNVGVPASTFWFAFTPNFANSQGFAEVDFYNTFSTRHIIATIMENDVAGVVITETNHYSSVDVETTDTIHAVLASEPYHVVTLTVSSMSSDEVKVSLNQGGEYYSDVEVSFSPSNWNIVQPIYMKGFADENGDGSISSVLSISSTSEDSMYNDWIFSDVIVAPTLYYPDDANSSKSGVQIIFGSDGDDIIHAGDGDDFIYDGLAAFGEHTGNDTIYGEGGNDTIKISHGHDVVYGDFGPDDSNNANAGDDRIIDQGEMTKLSYMYAQSQGIAFNGFDDDIIYAGPGNDHITLGDGHNEVYAGPGDDVIDVLVAVRNGDDIIKGGDGNDHIHLGEGIDEVWGDAGADMFIIDTAMHGSRTTIMDLSFEDGDQIKVADPLDMMMAYFSTIFPTDDSGQSGGSRWLTETPKPEYQLGSGWVITESESITFFYNNLLFGGPYPMAQLVTPGFTWTDERIAEHISYDIDDPIILDLNGNGVEFLALSEGVHFDLNGDGIKTPISWVAPSDGLLVMDLDQSGAIESMREVFSDYFNGQDFSGSLQALASLDSNQNQLIDAQDTLFGKILVWQDINSDGLSQSHELVSLAEANIQSLSLSSEPSSLIINGTTIESMGAFNLNNGQQHELAEVRFMAQANTLSNIDQFKPAPFSLNHYNPLIYALHAAILSETVLSDSLSTAITPFFAGQYASYTETALTTEGTAESGFFSYHVTYTQQPVDFLSAIDFLPLNTIQGEVSLVTTSNSQSTYTLTLTENTVFGGSQRAIVSMTYDQEPGALGTHNPVINSEYITFVEESLLTLDPLIQSTYGSRQMLETSTDPGAISDQFWLNWDYHPVSDDFSLYSYTVFDQTIYDAQHGIQFSDHAATIYHQWFDDGQISLVDDIASLTLPQSAQVLLMVNDNVYYDATQAHGDRVTLRDDSVSTPGDFYQNLIGEAAHAPDEQHFNDYADTINDHFFAMASQSANIRALIDTISHEDGAPVKTKETLYDEDDEAQDNDAQQAEIGSDTWLVYGGHDLGGAIAIQDSVLAHNLYDYLMVGG